MKNKNPYWFAVLLNLVTCIAVIWWSIWDMSFGLSILYIAEKHTMAMLDIGISSLGLMWGGWKGIKVVLFIIDLYTGPEKDRMRIREMKKIGLWREETTRDVTKYSECNLGVWENYFEADTKCQSNEISNCGLRERTGKIC